MIFQTGLPATPTNDWEPIDTVHIDKGEQLLTYKVPLVAFKFLSPASIQSAIEHWVLLKNAAAGPGEQLTDVTGIYMDDTTGEIDVRVNVTTNPIQTLPDGTPVEVSEAGVNYIQVLAVVAGLFAVIGISLVFIQAYRAIRDVAPLAAPVSIGLIVGIALGGMLTFWLLSHFTRAGT